MKKLISAILMALPLLCLSQYTYDQLEVELLTNETTAKNYTYHHLRLYPIRAKESFKSTFKDIGNYMSLKEAISKKKVKISEKSGGGSVNELVIENLSSDTIIVLPGEIIKGGKQDRVVNQDMVLSPRSGKKALPVFCVESGRWQYDGKDRTQNFDTHFSTGSAALRKVVEKEANQEKVWSKVDEINAKNKTQSHTKTYAAITTSKDLTNQLVAYRKFFMPKFQKDDRIIGVLAVSGNKIISCDMFATPWLFQQQFDNLLTSYATDAIIEGAVVSIHPAEVKRYLDKLLKSEVSQKEMVREKGKSFSDKGKKLRVSTY